MENPGSTKIFHCLNPSRTLNLVYTQKILHHQTPRERGDECAEYIVRLSKATHPRGGFVQPRIPTRPGT